MGLENRELKGRVATLESDLDASNKDRDAAKVSLLSTDPLAIAVAIAAFGPIVTLIYNHYPCAAIY